MYHRLGIGAWMHFSVDLIYFRPSLKRDINEMLAILLKNDHSLGAFVISRCGSIRFCVFVNIQAFLRVLPALQELVLLRSSSRATSAGRKTATRQWSIRLHYGKF